MLKSIMLCSNQFFDGFFFPISVLHGLQLISFCMCTTVVLLFMRQVTETGDMTTQPPI